MRDQTAKQRAAESAPDINSRIAQRVRQLRAELGMTLDGLAAKSTVSRSMLSLVERGESSPTAVVLERIATGLGVALAGLFDDASAPANPLSRRADRTTWRDPQSGYLRRNISPANDASPVHRAPPRGLRVVLLQIGLMDLSLSIDNVIAAVGLAPKDPSGDPVMWPIYAGVLIAILALQQIAPHAMNLLKKYPILEPTAFILIGYVGVLLVTEEVYRLVTGTPIHLPAYAKFVGILIIIWVALFYEADGAVRRLVTPIVRLSMPIMRGITRVVAVILWPLEYLLELLFGIV